VAGDVLRLPVEVIAKVMNLTPGEVRKLDKRKKL
jgi:hypothetical protein